ncbi:AEC family transporter [Vibrio ziniensis]|uniref:AEC family transporter n=1 Tax=Vibrio ziniensis TaxID=2711221 RepID=A0A6G7CQI2_9VIBR|nr:hypothetical protein [Vibrio ziniensis]QIH44411.1 hypothetical protein G5S32_20940 [Vibrio ziniensis]
MNPFVFTFSIIFSGFVLGLFFQRYLKQRSSLVSLVLTKIALMALIPFSVFVSLWQLSNIRTELLYLPLIGAAVIGAGTLVGILVARKNNLTPVQTGALVPVTALYNIGALGNLVLFITFGENGVAMMALFKLFEELTYFGLVFPYAKSKSQDEALKSTQNKQVWKDPIFLIAMCAISLGLLLNVSGVPRPEFLLSVSHWTIPVGTFLLIASVGLTFNLKGGKRWQKVALTATIARSAVAVVLVSILLSLFNLWGIEDHLVAKVCLILAVMPTAFMGTLPAVLYDLDKEVANTSWITSYFISMILTPIMLVFLSTI